MKRVIYIILLTFAFISLKGQSMKDANMLYKSANYKEAVSAYEALLAQDLESSSLYFNLGNSYYKLNKIAPAILNYERAKLLNPTDRDINYNLKMARTQVKDKIEEIPIFFLNRWMENLVMLLSSDIWAVLSVVAFCLMLILLIFFFFSSSRRLKKLMFVMSIFLFLSVVTSVIFASVQKNRLTNREYAIIFAPSVTIKGSPALSGTELFVLHEGTKVKILEKLGEWTNVQLSDGSEGWINNKALRVI